MPETSHIKAVRIERATDDNPDLSHLGRYSHKVAPGAIDRKARGDMTSREVQYFIPANRHAPFNPKNWAHVSEADLQQAFDGLPDEWKMRSHEFSCTAELLEHRYAEQDYERMEAYNRGDWTMVSIVAKADVVIRGVCQTLHSGGLWGIESDSDEGYIASVEQEELAALEGILAACGITER